MKNILIFCVVISIILIIFAQLKEKTQILLINNDSNEVVL